MGWGGSKSDFRWTISEAYHPTLISGIVPNYPLNRPFGSISDCSLFSIERSVFTWRHSSRDWRVISPDIFDPVPPRDRASKKVTTGSRSSCMKHNSVLCPSLFLSPHCPHRFSKSSFLDSIFNPFDWTKFGTTLETP